MSGEWWRLTHQLVPNDSWIELLNDNERLRGLLLAAIEGLEFKEPDFWLNTEPHVLRLTCEAVARQAKRATDQPDVALDRPWQEIVKNATRYMWLRERINWRDVDESGGAFSVDPLKYQARHWTHSDVRLPSLRPASEHVDEYIDGQLGATDPTDECLGCSSPTHCAKNGCAIKRQRAADQQSPTP